MKKIKQINKFKFIISLIKGKFISKKISLNPILLHTKNRKDIDYILDFLKKVFEEGVDPKKTLYYQFVNDIEKSNYYNPDNNTKKVIKLYNSIKKKGIKKRIPIVKCSGKIVRTKWNICGKHYIDHIKNETNYQIYDENNYAVYNGDLLQKAMPSPPSMKFAEIRLAIAIYLKHNHIPCSLLKIDKNYYAPDFTKVVKEKEGVYNRLIKGDRLRELHVRLNSIFMSKPKIENGDYFYQSFKKIRINGGRLIEERFKIYGLDKFLSKDYDVLDVGSNVGFFSLYSSDYVNSIDGIEPDELLIKVANITKKYLKIENCNFYNTSFEKFKTEKKYDFIFSFAVHRYMNIRFKEYLTRLYKLLKRNGQILIESHKIKGFGSNYFTNIIYRSYPGGDYIINKGVNEVVKAGLFKIVKKSFLDEYPGHTKDRRIFYALKKQVK